MSTIYDMLDLGPIVACDEEYGLIITVNGSYLNLWVQRGDTWVNTDCRSGHPDLYVLTVAKAMDLAKEWLQEIINGDEDSDEEDES